MNINPSLAPMNDESHLTFKAVNKMSKPASSRTYGRTSKKSRAPRAFIELAQSPVRTSPQCQDEGESVGSLAKKLETVRIEDSKSRKPRRSKTKQAVQNISAIDFEDPSSETDVKPSLTQAQSEGPLVSLIDDRREEEESVSRPGEPVYFQAETSRKKPTRPRKSRATKAQPVFEGPPIAPDEQEAAEPEIPATRTPTKHVSPTVREATFAGAHDQSIVESDGQALRILAWDDVCPPGDRIEKIAEASSAEVYRVTNTRGTSIIKVIRLPSPIKPKTKAQINARLVDEEPQSAEDVRGELQISEWLADIPGFVVYKERYIVLGKGTKELLETHQKFQRRMKRQDKGRAQFYPSPSRYLDETKFLVVELGDAGTALEDWKLDGADQLWDIFFLEAIALARAEETAMFEHRDLHEGNLCVRQRSPRSGRSLGRKHQFGHSGLDITILDYGLSRAEDLTVDDTLPVAYDLEKCLDLFTSTYASQCQVYRQMRSFLLRADRHCLPPEEHTTPYESGIDGPISWDAYAPYTNVLWLAYLYKYLTQKFRGDTFQLQNFTDATKEMWLYLNPDAEEGVPCFGSAADIVHFAVESGWIREEQLMDATTSMMEREDSIFVLGADEIEDDETELRRSPRRGR